MTQPTKNTRTDHASSEHLQQESAPRIQPAPKRYAHAYIRHFIIFALFVPAYYSFYNHEYYQDIFPAGILALLLTINIFHKWPYTLKHNRILGITLGSAILLYGIVCFFAPKHYIYTMQWRTDHFNIMVAFLFLLALILLKDPESILSAKVMRLTIWAIVINNILALVFRLQGYGRIRFQNLFIDKLPLDSATNAFHWLYHSPNEYALLLLLYMAFFMVYRKLFYNIWTYALSQALLLLCLYVTQAPGALLAAGFLFGGQLLHYVIRRFPILEENILYIAPVVIAFCGILLAAVFTKMELFHNKFLIWKGSLEIIRDNPQGFGVGFGVIPYETNYLPTILTHAENTFLVHMQRHTLPVGIAFLLLFVVLIIFSALSKPNFRTLGFWIAVLLMLNLDFALQTMNLPLVLFLIYCIFFKKQTKRLST